MELARSARPPSSPTIRIGASSYKAEVTEKGAWIVEASATGDHPYPIAQVLGDENVYYFLTPLERGHLQVLPLAFDVRTKSWMDTNKSMTVHENVSQDQPVRWRDRALTFSTSCYGSHVSQIETNYDPANDSHHATWREPDINCETCHGPAGNHVRLYEAAKKNGGTLPAELGLISFKKLTPAQRSDACAAMPSWPRLLPAPDATSSEDRKKFEEYVRFFQKYASKYNFDYLMLVAQGYQESGLNQGLKNPSEAVGIMQVIPKYAAAAPILVPDVAIAETTFMLALR